MRLVSARDKPAARMQAPECAAGLRATRQLAPEPTEPATPAAIHLKMPAAAPLPALRPAPLLPARHSRHLRAVMRLRQLQAVRCQRASRQRGATRFALDVFSTHRANSRLPAGWSAKHLPNAAGAQIAAERAPDRVVECEFAQVAALRERAYQLALQAHPDKRCDFCTELCDYILLGLLQPGAPSSKLAPTSVRVRSIDKFVNKLLHMATAAASPLCFEEPCSCQERIPSLLCELLQLPEDQE